MITRAIYLKEPEKWFGTKEEEELVLFCIEDLKERNVPECKEELLDGYVHWNNQKAVKIKIWVIFLSKKVLEVYNGNRKGNK